MTEVDAYTLSRATFAETLAEFAPEHREAILAFAQPGLWWRRLTTRLNPALALQLAIDPSLEHARAMLDEFDSSWCTDDIAKAAGLAAPHNTRPAQLRVVGVKVRLATGKTKRRQKTRCSH